MLIFFITIVLKTEFCQLKLNEEIVQELSEYSKRKEEIEIDLEKQEIFYGNKVIKFEIDTFKKKCLIEGLDDIDLSMKKSPKLIILRVKL